MCCAHINVQEQMDMSLVRRVRPGPHEVAERPRLPDNWQEVYLHPIVKLTRLEECAPRECAQRDPEFDDE